MSARINTNAPTEYLERHVQVARGNGVHDWVVLDGEYEEFEKAV